MDKIAAVINPSFGSGLSGQSGVSFAQNLIQTLIGLGFVVGAVVFIFMLIIGGVQWITSGGDKGAVESAKSKLTNALVGVTILFGLFAALNLVNCFFGVGFDRVTIGPYQIQFSGVVCPGGTGGNPGGGTPTPPLTGTCAQVNNDPRYNCTSLDPGFPNPLICAGGSIVCGTPSTQCDQIVQQLGNFQGSCCYCATLPPGGGTPTPTGGGTIPNGSPCGSDFSCVSGFCSSGVDIDGDTYQGSALAATGTCQPGPGDCNDNNANVHPNQTQYFQSAISGQPGNFDYDCSDSNGDGDPNDKWPNMDCLTTLSGSSCQLTPFPDSLASQAGWVGSVPGCGQPFFSASPVNFRTCISWYTNNMCGGGADVFPGCNLSTFCQTGTSSAGTPYQSWDVGDSPVFPGQIPGYTAMPCK